MKHATDQAECRLVDDHPSEFGNMLQAHGQVRCFAGYDLDVARPFASQFADHHLPGSNPDPHRQGPAVGTFSYGATAASAPDSAMARNRRLR